MRVDCRGITLLELIVSVSIFSLVGLMLAAAFSAATNTWRSTSASSDAQLALNKARDDLVRDLQNTSFASVRVAGGATTLGPPDGDVVWFLSAIDPSTGNYMRRSDGSPFWQRNILYYSIVPDNHSALFGYTCSGGADVDGYENQCPHKVLVRKVIDGGGATDPNDETTEETPLTASEASSYLTRPNGYDTSSMLAESGMTDVSLPSTNLLTFRVQLAPEPAWQREVRVELGSVSILTAGREVRIGSTPLSTTRFYRNLTLSVFPGLQ